MPVLILCSDCGRLIEVKPTKDRYTHVTIWSYCEECAEKRAKEERLKNAQQTIEAALSH